MERILPWSALCALIKSYLATVIHAIAVIPYIIDYMLNMSQTYTIMGQHWGYDSAVLPDFALMRGIGFGQFPKQTARTNCSLQR